MNRNIEVNNKEKSSIGLHEKVFAFVNHLLNNQLPANHTFHNWSHTFNVVRGSQEIISNTSLREAESEIILLAAWFHDTGHIKKCIGHEKESRRIAKDFLLKNNFPLDKIVRIMECIDATKMPQEPKNVLGEILCDADLYYLSTENYLEMLRCLREEWSLISKINYSEKKWLETNLTFLRKHKYFTKYGQETLENEKQKNIELLENKIIKNGH